MLDLRLEPGVLDSVPMPVHDDFRPECYCPTMPRDEDHDTDPAPPPKETPFPGTLTIIRLGDQGEAVSIIQRAVGVPDHGTFDLITEIGVRAFQTSHGLPVTGLCDVKTWLAISTDPRP